MVLPLDTCLSLRRLHKCVLLTYRVEDDAASWFLDIATKNDFIENVIRSGKVEDQVELADVTKVLIECLHKVLDCLECNEFIVHPFVDTNDEIESREALVRNDDIISVFNEVAVLAFPRQNFTRHLRRTYTYREKKGRTHTHKYSVHTTRMSVFPAPPPMSYTKCRFTFNSTHTSKRVHERSLFVYMHIYAAHLSNKVRSLLGRSKESLRFSSVGVPLRKAYLALTRI